MKRLSTEEFLAKFDQLWGSLQEEFFKLETLQDYVEEHNPAYDALVAGDLEAAIARIPDVFGVDDRRTTSHARRFQYARVRLVKWPLTTYVYWEFHVYAFNERFNKPVYVLEVSDDMSFPQREYVCDFLLFDSSDLLLHDYNADGRLTGGWHTNDKAELSPYRRVRDVARSTAVPFRAYLGQRRVSLREHLLASGAGQR